MNNEDRLEIIVKIGDERKAVRFEELHALKEQIEEIMLLWNANSYYVSRVNNTFIINGGRKLAFPQMGMSAIEYRRRSSIQMSVTDSHQQTRKVEWLVGLRGENEELLLIDIDETGTTWVWKNSL